LLRPEEILTLPPRWAISFPGGRCPPVLTSMVRYFEEPKLFKGRRRIFSRFRQALSTLLASITFLALGLALAMNLSEHMGVTPPPPQPMPSSSPNPYPPYQGLHPSVPRPAPRRAVPLPAPLFNNVPFSPGIGGAS